MDDALFNSAYFYWQFAKQPYLPKERKAARVENKAIQSKQT